MSDSGVLEIQQIVCSPFVLRVSLTSYARMLGWTGVVGVGLCGTFFWRALRFACLNPGLIMGAYTMLLPMPKVQQDGRQRSEQCTIKYLQISRVNINVKICKSRCTGRFRDTGNNVCRSAAAHLCRYCHAFSIDTFRFQIFLPVSSEMFRCSCIIKDPLALTVAASSLHQYAYAL